jgi:hypothetical protein
MRNIILFGIFLLFSHLLLSKMAAAQAVNCDPEPTNNMLIEYGTTVACTANEAGDMDIFHFFGNAGDEIIIQLRNATSLFDLVLYAPDNTELEAVGFKRILSIQRELPEDGVYTVIVEHTTPSANASPAPADYTLELPCLSGKCIAQLPPNILGYTAVTPCRIVDTRFGIGGAIEPGETRHFHVYGDISGQNKAAGGAPLDYPDSCPFALGEPSAVNINLTIVPLGPTGQKGWAAVWPWDEPRPAASWINYASGVQNIANAGTVATTASSGADPDISVYAPRKVHVIIDVLGYYK